MNLTRPIAAVLTTAFMLSGCAGNDDLAGPETTPTNAPSSSLSPPSPPTPSSTAGGSSTDSTPTETTTTESEPAADVTLTIVVKDGKVTPNGENVRVTAGQTVLISLTSDVAESIHVHGYDKSVAVKPGQTADLKFTADQKGVFEIETHKTEKLTAKLIVS